MKKTSPLSSSPLLLLSFSLFFLLAACGAPAQPPAEPATQAMTEPTALPPAEALPQTEISPTEIPTLLPAPTDTPIPEPTLAPAQLQIALLNSTSDLLLWQESDQTLHPLLPATNALDMRLSDDGSIIVFTKNIEFGKVELWAVNTDGSNARQLLSADAIHALDPETLGTTIYQMEWIPGTHLLAFNTVEYVQAPGQFLNDDLHFLNVDTGELSTQLTSGTGGNFVFSPDGSQYALIRMVEDSGTISLLNTDGTNLRENVLTYPYILTYSEYQYYAEPVWSPDSSLLRVAIPPHDSLGDPTALTSLWEIPTDGSPATQIGEILTQPLFLGGVRYSPDLTHLAYTRLANPEDYLNVELVLANADGSDETVYATGNLYFKGWSPNAQHFIYEDTTLQQTFLGVLGGAPTPLLADSPYATNPAWLDATRFLYSLPVDSTWQLRLGTVGLGSVPLLDLPDGLVRYDFDR